MPPMTLTSPVVQAGPGIEIPQMPQRPTPIPPVSPRPACAGAAPTPRRQALAQGMQDLTSLAASPSPVVQVGPDMNDVPAGAGTNEWPRPVQVGGASSSGVAPPTQPTSHVPAASQGTQTGPDSQAYPAPLTGSERRRRRRALVDLGKINWTGVEAQAMELHAKSMEKYDREGWWQWSIEMLSQGGYRGEGKGKGRGKGWSQHVPARAGTNGVQHADPPTQPVAPPTQPGQDQQWNGHWIQDRW